MFGLKDKHFGVASCAVRSLGRLAIGVMIARRLGTDGYSLFVLLVTTEVILSTLSNALYAQPLLTMAPGLVKRERLALEGYARRQVQNLSLVVLVVGALLSVILGASTSASAWTLLMFAAATAATLDADCCRAVRQGRFQARATVAADAMTFGFPVAGLLLVGDQFGATQTGMWGLLAVGQFLAIRVMRPRGVSVRPAPETLRRFRELAIPFASGSAVVSLSSRTQPYLLGALSSSAQLSWFGAAMSLMGPMRLLSGSLSAVLRPRLSLQHGHGDEAARVRCLRKALTLQLALGSFLMLVAIVAGTILVRWVFGEDFTPVAALLPIAVLFATMEGIGAVQTVAAQTRSSDGARLATRSRTCAGALGILLLFVLCPLVGGAGALWALVLAEATFLWQLLVPRLQAVKRERSMP